MSKKILINKNKGILFWVTGLSGSGKTAIAKKIKNRIAKLYGPTIEVSGDNFRKVFKLTKYDPKERIKNEIANLLSILAVVYVTKTICCCQIISD